jgi:hypothetical protein
MPGYLKLLRQARIKAGEISPPTQRPEGYLIRKFVSSYRPVDFLVASPTRDIKNKLSNDFNDGCLLERERVSEDTNLTKKFGAPRTPPYRAALEALLAKCPEGILNSRYMQAVTDAESILAVWGTQAEMFGWTAEDLFGLDSIAPLRRHDAMGLIWSLQGCPVAALTQSTAVIRMQTGNTLSFYRRDVEFPWRRNV